MNKQLIQRARPVVETSLIGGAGSTALVMLGVPGGAILGALLATAVASLAGRKLGWPSPIRAMLFMIMGYSAGASVTPSAVAAALLWPLSLVALAAVTLAMWTAGALVFRWLTRTDGRTAFFAAAPGALSTVLVLAEEHEADLSRVAVAQSLRLLILVCLSPLATVTLTAHPTVLPPEAPAMVGGLAGWSIAVAVVLASSGLAQLLRWPAAPFMGALLGSIAIHGPGLVHATPPREVLLVAGGALGALIGSRFVGLDFRHLVRQAPACVALVVAMALVGVPAGILIGTVFGVGPLAGVMAFAPGSMEVLVALSLSFNAHPAYVAAHHITRTLLLVGLMPALAALDRFRDRPAPEAD